jgi:hypothetical protein
MRHTDIADSAEELGLPVDTIKMLWGKRTIDIYLSQDVYWSNVPKAAWNYGVSAVIRPLG